LPRPVCSAARADCAAFGSTRGARCGAIEADVGQGHSLRGGERRGAPDRNGRATRVAERVRGRHWLPRVKTSAWRDRSGYAHASHMAKHVERTSTRHFGTACSRCLTARNINHAQHASCMPRASQHLPQVMQCAAFTTQHTRDGPCAMQLIRRRTQPAALDTAASCVSTLAHTRPPHVCAHCVCGRAHCLCGRALFSVPACRCSWDSVFAVVVSCASALFVGVLARERAISGGRGRGRHCLLR
jgi:hypothetical protein